MLLVFTLMGLCKTSADGSLYKSHPSLFLCDPCFHRKCAVIYSIMKREVQLLFHVYLFFVSVFIKTTLIVEWMLTCSFLCIISFHKSRFINQDESCNSWELQKTHMIFQILVSQSYTYY